MSRRPLRDDLRDLFEVVSEPAHPALAARIRDEIGSRPAPVPRVPRLAAAIAVVVSVAVVAGLVLAGRQGMLPAPAPASTGQPAASPVPSELPTATPAPSPGSQATPSASPIPPAASPAPSQPAALPGFTCATQAGGAGGAAVTAVTAVRAGAQTGYDRFVIELNGPVPRYEVRPQDGATFTEDASGRQVVLDGSSGLLVRLWGTSSFGTYSGPTDLKPAGTATLREARQVGDFEGVVSWGLGLSHASCFRVLTLTGPARLVVDIQA